MAINIDIESIAKSADGIRYSAYRAGDAPVSLSIASTATPNEWKITGTAFGANPEMQIHDDFIGTNGNDLVGWTLGSSHGTNPKYSSTRSLVGSTSAKADMTGAQYNSSAENQSLNSLTEAYLSYYVYIDKISDPNTRNLKLARLSGGYSGGYIQSTGVTMFGSELANNAIAYNYYDSGSTDYNQTWNNDMEGGRWMRVQMYLKQSSTPGATDGVFWAKADDTDIALYENVVTDNTGTPITWLTLPYYVAHDAGGDYNMYYDNVYLSKQVARVEIGNAATYAASTEITVAELKSWTPSEVIFDYPHGGTKWAYVRGSDNSLINTSGLAL